MILSCQNLSKAFGDKVILKDASFHIEEREKSSTDRKTTEQERPLCCGSSWMKSRQIPALWSPHVTKR